MGLWRLCSRQGLCRRRHGSFGRDLARPVMRVSVRLAGVHAVVVWLNIPSSRPRELSPSAGSVPQ